MYDPEKLAQLRQELEKWEETTLQHNLSLHARTEKRLYHHIIRTGRSCLHAAGRQRHGLPEGSGAAR